MSALVATLAVAAAVVAWPAARSADGARDLTGAGPAGRSPAQLWQAGSRRLRLLLRPDETVDDVIHVVESTGAALKAGLGPADALVLVVRSRDARPGRAKALDDALPALESRARNGELLSGGWREAAATLRSPQILVLARAWALSEATGAPLSEAAATAARLMRVDRDRHRRSVAAVAGARATMRILTLLPLSGPLLAGLLGVDLVNLYARSAAVWACIGGGLVLIGIGRWWVDRLIAAAMRGPELR